MLKEIKERKERGRGREEEQQNTERSRGRREEIKNFCTHSSNLSDSQDAQLCPVLLFLIIGIIRSCS